MKMNLLTYIRNVNNKSSVRIDNDVFLLIRRLGLGVQPPTKRGTRAGRLHRIWHRQPVSRSYDVSTLAPLLTLTEQDTHHHDSAVRDCRAGCLHRLWYPQRLDAPSTSTPDHVYQRTPPKQAPDDSMSVNRPLQTQESTQIPVVTNVFERLPVRRSLAQGRPKRAPLVPLDSGRTPRSKVIDISGRQKLKEQLRVGHYNCQSVGAKCRLKRTKIVEFIKDECVDVMFLTETWLRSTGDDAKCADLTPPGYDIRSFPRATRGGGLAVIYHSHLPVTFTSTFPFQHTSLELVQFTLNTPHTVHIFCLYRPPPSRKNKLLDSTFLSELPDLLDYCNQLRGKSVIVGDLNVHYDVPTDHLTSKVLDILTRFSLVQGIERPTYYRSGHIIDWVVYRDDDQLVDCCTVSHKLSSDHAAVLTTLHVVPPQDPPIYRTVRDINAIDRGAFKADIQTMLQGLGAELSAQHLDDGLRALLDKHAPPMVRRVPTGRSSPWYAGVRDQLRIAKHGRRRAERRWLKTGLAVDRQIYWTAKEAVAEIVQKAKEDYWSSKVKSCVSTKALYNASNRLLGNSKNSTLPTDIAPEQLPDAFADFFITKVQAIREELDSATPAPSSPFSEDVNRTESFDGFRPVAEDEVRRVINRSASKSCALDPIPVPLLVECLEVLLPALTSIINSSILSGIFPSIFKRSIVLPLLKKPSLDPNTLKNYRPVSNLSFLSKVIEKLVLSQLSDYLHSRNLYPSSQSAYRPGHSTETALVRVMSDLLRAMDDGKLSILTLLDLSAAFDTIDHQILLDRLHLSFGLCGSALNWFQSYLSDRTQTVSISNRSSKPSALSLGVPQGSVLGPVLFIIYTAPLSSLIRHHSLSSHSYADDTQISASCFPDQLDATILRMQECVGDVKRWMTCNKLKLNDDKTEILLIHSQNKPLPPSAPSSISIGNSDITLSSSARNLGVTITDTLSMDKHVTNICRSAYNEIRKISTIRHLLSLDATKTLVCSLILSKFDYCNTLLAGIPQHHIDKLQKAQHSACRLILKARKHDHIQPHMRQLHWLPISSRIMYKSANLCFNSFTDPHFPAYLSELLLPYIPTRQLRSSTDKRTLLIPRTKTKTIGERSFFFHAPTFWNQLPFHVRHCQTSPTFKKYLKTHLFRSAYDL